MSGHLLGLVTALVLYLDSQNNIAENGPCQSVPGFLYGSYSHHGLPRQSQKFYLPTVIVSGTIDYEKDFREIILERCSRFPLFLSGNHSGFLTSAV